MLFYLVRLVNRALEAVAVGQGRRQTTEDLGDRKGPREKDGLRYGRGLHRARDLPLPPNTTYEPLPRGARTATNCSVPRYIDVIRILCIRYGVEDSGHG